MSLEIKNIVKKFKDDVVLDGVSLSVKTGETLVLFGPSGAGKTVLLRLLAGVIEAEEGTIEIHGKDMAGVEAEERGIGMAFQNFALFPHMDAEENIGAALLAQRKSKSTIKAGVQSLAKLLKIDHVLSHKPKELSNGQKQRTALARALAGNPSILLLDDPLRNVDAKLRFEMRLELPRLLSDQEATVIYVTQDYKEAMALGHNIAVMSDHKVQQIGTPEDIYLTPQNLEIAKLFGDPVINFLDVVPEKSGKNIQVELSDIPIILDDIYADCVGKNCILGIRPEAIEFTKKSAKGAIPVQVDAETPLNEKTVTLVRPLRGREIMISRPAGTPGPKSGEGFIKINGSNTMLFDRKTGIRIDPKIIQGEAA